VRDRRPLGAERTDRWKDSLQSSNFVPHSCDDLLIDGEVIGGHCGASALGGCPIIFSILSSQEFERAAIRLLPNNEGGGSDPERLIC